MSQTATEIQTGCTTCGSVGSTEKTYLTRGPDVVVQGVRLATCAGCLPPPQPVERSHCDGRCQGTFTTTVGTYHELRWRPLTATGRHSTGRTYRGWACWDAACVEAWAESSWVSHDSTIEYAIHTVVDGTSID